EIDAAQIGEHRVILQAARVLRVFQQLLRGSQVRDRSVAVTMRIRQFSFRSQAIDLGGYLGIRCARERGARALHVLFGQVVLAGILLCSDDRALDVGDQIGVVLF